MWFCYENGIWIPDVGNLKVMEMCKSLANQLLTYALTIQDEHQRKAYIDYCRKWQSRRYRETVLKDAQSVYPISMAEFDQDPLMLNCANGTLFLMPMDFRPHNSEDRLTKISGVKYDPLVTVSAETLGMNACLFSMVLQLEMVKVRYVRAFLRY